MSRLLSLIVCALVLAPLVGLADGNQNPCTEEWKCTGILQAPAISSTAGGPYHALPGETVPVVFTYTVDDGVRQMDDVKCDKGSRTESVSGTLTQHIKTVSYTVPADITTPRIIEVPAPSVSGSYPGCSGGSVSISGGTESRALIYVCVPREEMAWGQENEVDIQEKQTVAYCWDGKTASRECDYHKVYARKYLYKRVVYDGGGGCPDPTEWERVVPEILRDRFLRDYRDNYKDTGNCPPGGGGGGDDDHQEEEQCEEPASPNDGETYVSGEIVTDDPDRTVFVKELPPAAEDGEPAPQFVIPVGHRIVTHNTPRARDLAGKLKLKLPEGQTMSDAFTLEAAVKDENGNFVYDANGEQVWAPYTVGDEMPVLEKGHSGCGDHDWHSGVEIFRFTMHRRESLTLIAEVDPDAEASEGDGGPKKRVTIVFPLLLTDADRNGTIDYQDAALNSSDKPFRFWVNDDDDSDDTGGTDIPGQQSGANYTDGVVNGTRDLVDFFPVYLDIKQLIENLPDDGSVKYKLKHEEGAVNFVYTKLTKADALAYQTQDKDTIFGSNMNKKAWLAETSRITAAGVELSSSFLAGIKDQDWGVILVEGRAKTTAPLVLSVEKSDGTVLAEIKLELSLDSVNKMFRHLNLRDGNDAPDGLVGNRLDTGDGSSMDSPENLPDSLNGTSWFVFVVGSNVGGQNARGWETEIFKRMYWSHSKARFIGVSWFGDPYADSGDFVYDYHMAVRNAFTTAGALAGTLDALPGSKTIAAHSLGCGVVSSAIADYGLSVANFCMIDAALAMESFKADLPVDLENMAMTPWTDDENPSVPAYNRRVWAAEWHALFDASDARSKLTWRGRFNGATAVTHNFYSSTEDVLAKLAGTPPSGVIDSLLTVGLDGRYAWVVQEKTKGQKLSLLFGHVHAGSDYGGWGFNTTDPVDPADPIYYTVRATPDTVNGHGFIYTREPTAGATFTDAWPSDDVLRRVPVFDPGWGGLQAGPSRNVQAGTIRGPDWIKDLYGATGSATAGDVSKRAQLLAEAIPALTLATGANDTAAFLQSKNHNLPEECVDNGRWPRPKLGGIPIWQHSDTRVVAYYYTYKLFDQLKEISEPNP